MPRWYDTTPAKKCSRDCYEPVVHHLLTSLGTQNTFLKLMDYHNYEAGVQGEHLIQLMENQRCHVVLC
jgi:hypothetical protein